MAKTWHGRQGTVEVDDAIGEVDDDSTLDEQVGGATYTGDVMEIDIADPAADVEVENTFGGQFKVETPAELVEFDVTMRFRDISILEEMHGEADPVDGTEFHRISGTREPGDRRERAFLFELEDNGDVVRYLLNNAIFQQMGDITLDAEGFAEISGTVVCLVEDRHTEDNISE